MPGATAATTSTGSGVTLLSHGHNLLGVQRILELEAENARLRAQVRRLRDQRPVSGG